MTASAQQAISCTAFLHNRDGSWRSLADQVVFGPSGRLRVAEDALLRPTDQTPLGEIARALNEICESH